MSQLIKRSLCRRILKNVELKFVCGCICDVGTRNLRTAGTPLSGLLKPEDKTKCQRQSISLWGSSKVTEWSKAVSEAEKIVGYPTSFMSLRCLLSDELSNVAMQMRKLVGTRHPLLKTARKFFYDDKHSIQTRGLLVLLMSKTAGPGSHDIQAESEPQVSGIYPSQRNLAEIIEMINTAHMIHKGVVNLGPTGLHTAESNKKDMHFGNKMSVLSGDFLLANASTSLAELNNTYVVELISSAIGDLVEADFVGLSDEDGTAILTREASMDSWRHHTYMSSGSLIAKSCQAAMILAGHSDTWQRMAFRFGKHMAYAHQLNEDILPFIRSHTDSVSGTPLISSAPLILYSQKYPQKASEHKLYNNPTVDPTTLRQIVTESDVLEEAKDLCQEHGRKALDALQTFPDTEARTALTNIVTATITL